MRVRDRENHKETFKLVRLKSHRTEIERSRNPNSNTRAHKKGSFSVA